MKKATEPSTTELADAAFLQAMHKVIARAIAANTPVIVWENGQVKELDPRTIKLPEPKLKKTAAGWVRV